MPPLPHISVAVSGRNRVPTTYVFNQDEVFLGRSSKNDIVFDPLLDGSVSRRHASIRRAPGGNGAFVLEDLGSTQGTFVNNQPIRGPMVLHSRDSIVLGIDGPRVHVSFEKDESSTTESDELLRSPSAAHFPLALYGEFPRRFAVFQKIGEGGYGQVWRGMLRGSEEWRAIKFLRPELLIAGQSSSSMIRIEKLTDRFRREAEVTRLLSASGARGIIRVEEVGGDPQEGFLYMIMEYVEGDSLDHLITKHRDMSEATICRYLRQVAEALNAAHSFEWTDSESGRRIRGIVHRDIKPSNILIRRADDEAILCDFGIAAMEEGGERLTLPQMRVFTYKFTAPEVLLQNIITPATDLWGLAVTAYVLLSGGFFPYGGMGMGETLKAIEERRLISVKSYRGKMNAELGAFVESALDPDPDRRPKTARDWADAMTRFENAALGG